jgi:hypothetical protein
MWKSPHLHLERIILQTAFSMVFPHLCGAVYLCGAFPNTLAADQLYKEQIVYLAVLIRKKNNCENPCPKWSSCGKPNSFYNPKIPIFMGRLPCCQHEWENHGNKWGSFCS